MMEEEEDLELLAVSDPRPDLATLIAHDGNGPHLNKQIGDYRIERTLGQGTFGKVKQGIHIHTNQKVIINSR